ncbi:MAG TPA: hypothetical protein VFN09_08535 [Rhodanobacteraceae bacterium]|nr:hypothetical protein [Rhodanobacteraceae bacterium]
MQTTPELTLSNAFKRSQRALARWLEQVPGSPLNVFRARASLRALDANERGRLVRWLAWQSYAAERNGNPALLARIERLEASLGRAARAARPQLPILSAVSADGASRRSA